MTNTLLLLNTASGSFKDGIADELTAHFVAAGLPAPDIHAFPETPLPDRHRLIAGGYDTLAIYTGDGTINSTVQAIGGWDGTVLILPGGTQNLLSKSLHGDRPVEAIIADFAGQKRWRIYPPVIIGAGHQALVTVIAGPTTAWAEVREQVRQRDLGALADAVPEAVSQTLGGDGVRLDRRDTRYQAITLVPTNAGIQASGVLTDGPGKLLRQGAAWLSGDFRKGPSDPLGSHQNLRIVGEGPLGLLIDGEQAEAEGHADFRLGKSKVAMWATVPVVDAE